MEEGKPGDLQAPPIPGAIRVAFWAILGLWYGLPILAHTFASEDLAQLVSDIAAVSFWPLSLLFFVAILGHALRVKRRLSVRVLGLGLTLAFLGFSKTFLTMGIIGLGEILVYQSPQTTTGVVQEIRTERAGSSFNAFVDFTYSVDGTEYKRSDYVDGCNAPSAKRSRELAEAVFADDRVEVFYLPNDPTTCSLNPEWSPLLGWVVLLVFGLVAVAGVIYYLIHFGLLPARIDWLYRSSGSPLWDALITAAILLVCSVQFARTRNMALIVIAVLLVLVMALRNRILAHLGLVISAVAFAVTTFLHVGTFAGFQLLELDHAFWLHLLIFFLALPLLLRNIRPFGGSGRRTVEIMSETPTRMTVGLLVFFVYALFNFFFCGSFLLEGNSVGIVRGQKVMHDHGDVVRVLSDEQYEQLQAYELRGVSGHWLFFYWFAVCAYLSWVRGNGEKRSP